MSLNSPSSSSVVTSPTQDELVSEKTAKIKLWVHNRLQELEEQNERLRLQNLRCATQLQLLQSYSAKSKKWREQNMNAFSRSVTGVLPVIRDMENRTSDDSGLTSDDCGNKKADKPADLMTKSTSDAMGSTPRAIRKLPGRLRANSLTVGKETNGINGGGEHEGEEGQSSTTDSSPWDEVARPIPTPRKNKNPLHALQNGNVMERDSLNSFADDYEFDCEEEEEEFDEIAESPVEKIMRRSESKHADYVNLADFVKIRDDADVCNSNAVYADIHKRPPSNALNGELAPPPPLPRHKPLVQWETRLCEMADRCLSLYAEEATSSSPTTPYHVTPLKDKSPHEHSSSSLSGSRRLSSCRASPINASSPRNILSSSPRHLSSSLSENPQHDYSLPPDASCDFRASLIPTTDMIEKSGNWLQMSESRLKSLKRRYVVLKNRQLSFYRTQKNESRDEEPLMRIPISELRSVQRIPHKDGNYAFQLATASSRLNYMTESEKTTEDWVNVLNAAIKSQILSEMAHRTRPVDATIAGFVVKTRCGHAKRCYAALVQHKLMFFKTPDDKVPSSYIYLRGARVCEKSKGSSDEYSGSSDEQTANESRRPKDRPEYSICIEIANEDPVYVVLRSAEEKEKWLYYLRITAGDANLFGTPFEVLVQRMLADGATPESPVWRDVLLTSCEEHPKETLTSVDSNDKKKALEIDRACYLFVSVLMRPTGVQYHVDLAQNILSTAIHHDFLKNEVYAQLVKLTSENVPNALQGWKLMALALPLFVPKQYAILWLLKKHIARWSLRKSDEGNMAGYCSEALERCLKMGGRTQGPSRLEAISVLIRDPTSTKFPHSISVQLPNGDYQVVEFDGSTEIGQCLSSLCLKLGMRPALLSGYALYIDDPSTGQSSLLKGKQKLCDCLSEWEKEVRETRKGRVTEESQAVRLRLRMRHYWRHLTQTETHIERSFLVQRMAEEIVRGRVPMSNELAEELAALYAQLTFGDMCGAISDAQFDFVTKKFYPAKLLDVTCHRTLRANIVEHWSHVAGMSETDCIRLILQVLRKWRFFGAHIQAAGQRAKNEEPVLISLNDMGVHLLDAKQLEVLRSFPYHSLVSFGGYHADFMLTVERVLPPGAHPEETARERLTFSMKRHDCDQLTLHLAEYIRCQKLVWKVSKFSK